MTDWRTPVLEKAYPDEDCGCPVEEWVVCGINLMIHFEEDGRIDVFADAGDWDRDFTLKATTMEDARKEAFAWVYALPMQD